MIMLFNQEESVKRYGNRRATEARAEGRNEGMLMICANMVAKGMIAVETATQELGMSTDQFREAVKALNAKA